MSATTQITVHGGHSMMPTTYFPTESDWKMMIEIGGKAVRSGLLPKAITTPEAAAIIALKAREVGIPIMMGFSHIHIINGRPTLSAELMQALVRRNLPGILINIIQSDSKQAKIEFTRPEPGSKPFLSSFTLDDAKAADLLKKDVWRMYPGAMLWARAVSQGIRRVCPEATLGISYTPEELDAPVDKDGNVIETKKADLDEVEAILDLREELKNLMTEKNLRLELGQFIKKTFGENVVKLRSIGDLNIALDWLKVQPAKEKPEAAKQEKEVESTVSAPPASSAEFEQAVSETPDPRNGGK